MGAAGRRDSCPASAAPAAGTSGCAGRVGWGATCFALAAAMEQEPARLVNANRGRGAGQTDEARSFTQVLGGVVRRFLGDPDVVRMALHLARARDPAEAGVALQVLVRPAPAVPHAGLE